MQFYYTLLGPSVTYAIYLLYEPRIVVYEPRALSSVHNKTTNRVTLRVTPCTQSNSIF